MRDLKHALISAGFRSKEVYFQRLNDDLLQKLREHNRSADHDPSRAREGPDQHRIASRARAPDRKAS